MFAGRRVFGGGVCVFVCVHAEVCLLYSFECFSEGLRQSGIICRLNMVHMLLRYLCVRTSECVRVCVIVSLCVVGDEAYLQAHFLPETKESRSLLLWFIMLCSFGMFDKHKYTCNDVVYLLCVAINKMCADMNVS